jgi:hypothetical protein
MVNQHGGVDIVQVAQSQITFSQGLDQIRCARLSAKGLYRFYADCCRMPLGNAMSRGVPFVGLPTELFETKSAERIGTAVGIYAKSALTPPVDAHAKVPLAMMGRIVRLMLQWKWKSRGTSSAYFRDDGTAISQPIIIDAD